jgi:glycoprotein 6-alpha-L-fucosyltransferase
MFFIINYYKKLALKGFSGEKVVFVASDDSNAIKEFRNKYKDFRFIDKKFYFSSTAINDKKYSPNNLLHTIIDIHFLARSDFLVCTMSSNVRNDIFSQTKYILKFLSNSYVDYRTN